MNLHEELANISYIFCDKTGTLTQNELVFKSLSLVGLSDESLSKVFEATGGDSAQMAQQMASYAGEANLQHFFKCVGLCHDCIVVTLNEKTLDG